MSYKLDLTELKMINFSLWKNESELDDMGNMDSPKTIEIINCILNVPLIFMSTIGNALVLTAVLRTSLLRSAPSIVFLCSLAVSDLLVGLVAQPVYISNALIYSDSSPALKQATEVMFFLACGVSLHHASHQRGSVFSSSLPYALFGSDDSETYIIYYSRHLVCVCYFVMSEDSLEKKSSFSCHRCRWHCYLPLYFNLFVYQNLSNCKASQVGYSITTTGHTKVEC